MPHEVDYHRKSRSPKREKVRHRERSRDKEREKRSDRDRDRRHGKSDKPRDKHHSNRQRTPPRTSLRRRPYQYWDVAPPGFEHVTPDHYKAMQQIGQVPLEVPGGAPLLPAIAYTGSTMSRQARRIYVGGIPFKATEDELMDMFNKQMKLKGYSQAEGNPIIAVQINVEKNYAFLEFRSSEETTAALAFDGITLRGQPLKLRRPRDYVPPYGNADGEMDPLMIGDSPNKIYVGGLPSYLGQDQVKELLISFGPITSFNLVVDEAADVAKCYCVYVDPASVDKACAGLNGMTLGDRTLVAQRVSGGLRPAITALIPQLPGTGAAVGSEPPTEVLCLMNMVTIEDLVDDDDFQDIFEDVQQECSKFGEVKSMEIPRPSMSTHVPGVGKIYVEFDSITSSQKAQLHLSGRKFMDRVVVSSFFSVGRYHNKDF